MKHSFLVKNAEEIPEVVKKAFYIATTGWPAPVVTGVPKDVTSPADRLPYCCPGKLRMRFYNPAGKGHGGSPVPRRLLNMVSMCTSS